jgi:hypothetical protein
LKEQIFHLAIHSREKRTKQQKKRNSLFRKNRTTIDPKVFFLQYPDGSGDGCASEIHIHRHLHVYLYLYQQGTDGVFEVRRFF